MTAQEFHINFNIELDKTLDFEYPYISHEQIDYWLNKGQERFIKSRLFGNNQKGQGFEESQKRIDDLRTIVKVGALITPTGVGSTVYQSLLPEDYLYLVRHQVNVSAPGSSEFVSGKQVTNDEINIMLKDPFWRPDKTQPLYYIIENKIIYEGVTGFTINSTRLSYIRKYNKIRYGTEYITPTTDIQCELPDNTHQEILDITIAMVLENIESQRYQTNINELTKTE